MNLDRTDLDLIGLLQNNARLSNKELAAKVGLAPSSCLIRVRNLLKKSVLKNFHAEVNPQSIGIGIQAMLSVTLNVHSQTLFQNLTKYINSLPEVRAYYHLSGSVDVMIHVMVKDTEHLRQFVLEKVTGRDEIARCDTSLIYEEFRNATLPIYTEVPPN